MQLHRFFRRGLGNSTAVVIGGLLLLILSATLGALVAHSVTAMSVSADQIDDARAVTAAGGAIKSLRTRLASTIRDNAYWDDAYTAVSGPGGVEWITGTWGKTTENYPLYDTAIVFDPANKPIMAYHDGKAMADPFSYFDGSLRLLIAKARLRETERDNLPVAFVKTAQGIAVVAASAIQPYDIADDADLKDNNVLLFAKLLTSGVVADVRTTFNIRGLMLSENKSDNNLNAMLRDITGNQVGYFVWPRVNPGAMSLDMVKPQLRAAAVIFMIIIVSIVAISALLIRDSKRRERQFEERATHDPLTSLWNRAGLYHCASLLAAEILDNPASMTLHLIDLDGFKAVNDAWGHQIGDQLLQDVARRLALALPDEVQIARLGGDEFAILSSSKMTLNLDVGAVVQRTLNEPFPIGGRIIKVGASVGYITASGGKMDIHEMLRRADLALYRAKEAGRGVNIAFDPAFDTQANQLAELEQSLRDALAGDEIKVMFQPLIDAQSGAIRGVEALARWIRPNGQIIPPDVFIPAAERSGLIDELGLRVADLAFAATARWNDTRLSLNISPIQLKNPYLVANLAHLMIRHDFPPSRLTVEVTEGVLIADPDQAKRTFDEMKAMGIKIALDDFGCGYASIGALRNFGFDRLKIDRSLVEALEGDNDASAVLQATIALANALRVQVTAEGIETEMQASIVTLSGCDELQGYLFSRPLEASDIVARYFHGLPPRTAAA